MRLYEFCKIPSQTNVFVSRKGVCHSERALDTAQFGRRGADDRCSPVQFKYGIVGRRHVWREFESRNILVAAKSGGAFCKKIWMFSPNDDVVTVVRIVVEPISATDRVSHCVVTPMRVHKFRRFPIG